MNREKFMLVRWQILYKLIILVAVSIIIGIIVGTITALFLKSLDFATAKRIQNPWIIFFLPIVGAGVSYVYTKYGKNSALGNNLIIDKINEKDCELPLRMAALVFLGTVFTHLFGGSAGKPYFQCAYT